MAPSESRELRCEGGSLCKACEDGRPSWVEIIPASAVASLPELSVTEKCLMCFLSLATASEICTASVCYPSSFGPPAALCSVRTQVMRLYQPPPPQYLLFSMGLAPAALPLSGPVVRAVVTHVAPQPRHSLQFCPCLSLILQHRRCSLLHLRKAGVTVSGPHSLPRGPLLGQLLLPHLSATP